MSRLLITVALLLLCAPCLHAQSPRYHNIANVALRIGAGFPAVSQSIASVNLSGNSFVGGSASGTSVGSITVTMSPASPPFSGSLSLSTTTGGCNSTTGANNGDFQISGTTLETNGTVAAGTYAACLLATQAGIGNSPVGQSETITGTASSSAIDPGPSAALFAAPYYTCSTNYYVAASGGSDSNNGTSSGSAWATLAHAATAVSTAGSCINLAAGVYSQSAGPLTIGHGGNTASATGYIVWRCETMPFTFSAGVLQGEGSGCVIKAATTNSNLVDITAPYVMFDGIELSGNNFEAYGVCLDMEQGGSTGDGTSVHHIWLTNSDVHHCGQSGIQWNYSEWFFVIHDVWHDNAACSADYVSPCANSQGVYGSGLSFYDPVGKTGYTPTAMDNAWCSTVPAIFCFHDVVAYNVAYHNYNGQSGTGNTDGEGIIFDDWGHTQNTCPGTGTCPYTGAGLIMGNLIYDNGGEGIKSFSWASTAGAKVTVANNTAYGNAWDTHNTGTYRGDIFQNGADNVTNINNIGYRIGGSGILADNSPFTGQGNSGSPGNLWNNNLSYAGGFNNFGTGNSYPTTGTNKNDDGVNPTLATLSLTAPSFALQSGSPAIAFGQAFTLWQQSGTVDAGACPYSAPGPLTNCP